MRCLPFFNKIIQENDVIETSNNNDNTNNRDSLNTDPLAELEAVTTAYIETITPGIEEPIEPWGGAVNTAYDYSSEGNQDKLASYNDNESVISPYENTNPTPQVPYVQPVGNVVKYMAHSSYAKKNHFIILKIIFALLLFYFLTN